MSKQSTLFSLHHPKQDEPVASVQFPSGAIEVSDIIDGRRVSRKYLGYTKAEAVAMFREQTKPTTLAISPL